MWKALLAQTVAYEGIAVSAVEVEAQVAAARAAHRARLAGLERLSREHDALRVDGVRGLADGASVVDVWSAAWGPGQVGPRLRSLLAQVFGGPGSPAPDLELLEQRVETAQRRVLQIAHLLDGVSADGAQLRHEMSSLAGRIRAAERDAGLAARAILTLQAGYDAAGASGDPSDAADAARLEALLWEREAELRAHQRVAQRLSSILVLERHFVGVYERLHASLSRLHAAGVETLDELDHHLSHLAAEAQAADLTRAIAGAMDALRLSVQRVDVAATAGAALLVDNLDRLSDEVDLLAPADPREAAAEAEVAAALRSRSVDEAVARARAEVRRRASHPPGAE
jgi:hypothetical protein